MELTFLKIFFNRPGVNLELAEARFRARKGGFSIVPGGGLGTRAAELFPAADRPFRLPQVSRHPLLKQGDFPLRMIRRKRNRAASPSDGYGPVALWESEGAE